MTAALPPAAALDLRRDLATLAETARVCRRTKWPSKTKIVTPKQRSKREQVTWCTLCRRPWPHRTHAEWDWHMMGVRRAMGPRALHARGHYSKENARLYGLASGRARYRRAIVRRAAIVKQITPHVYAVLGPAGVEQFINRCRYGRLQYMCSIAVFITKVRKLQG